MLTKTRKTFIRVERLGLEAAIVMGECTNHMDMNVVVKIQTCLDLFPDHEADFCWEVHKELELLERFPRLPLFRLSRWQFLDGLLSLLSFSLPDGLRHMLNSVTCP